MYYLQCSFKNICQLDSYFCNVIKGEMLANRVYSVEQTIYSNEALMHFTQCISRNSEHVVCDVDVSLIFLCAQNAEHSISTEK